MPRTHSPGRTLLWLTLSMSASTACFVSSDSARRRLSSALLRLMLESRFFSRSSAHDSVHVIVATAAESMLQPGGNVQVGVPTSHPIVPTMALSEYLNQGWCVCWLPIRPAAAQACFRLLRTLLRHPVKDIKTVAKNHHSHAKN